MWEHSAFAVGVDLGDRWSAVCVLDADGAIVEESRLRTQAEGLRAWFGLRGRMRVAMEVGTHSPWVSRLVESLGHEVYVANPRRVRLIWQQENKSDRIDAEALARLVRVDPELLSPVRHRGEGAQRDLAAVRARAALVRVRTMLVTHVRGVVKASGERMPVCSVERFGRLLERVPEGLCEAMRPMFESLTMVTVQIRECDARIKALVEERYPDAARLQQVPSIGPVTALTYVLTLEDPHRFRKSRSVGAFVGLTPGRSQSGERDPQRRITHAGDPYLRQLLVGCAQRTLGPHGRDTDLRRWGLRLAASGGRRAKKRAVVAVARKLAVILHQLWISGGDYEPFSSEGRKVRAKAAATA
jgi:transposase